MNVTNFRRLQNEIKKIKESQEENEKMFILKMKGDDMYHWEAILYGPDGSLYEGSKYLLDIVLPQDYPHSPLNIKFITPIEHVNVNTSGNICLDILKNKWVPTQNMISVLISICALLSDPNPDDAFNSDLAHLYRVDKESYLRKIKKSCEKNQVQK